MKKISKKIIKSAQNSNPEAIEYIIDYYSNLVYYISSKSFNDKLEIDDCTQEVLIRIIKVLPTFDSKKSEFSTWIYNVINSTVINYVNTYKRHKNKFEVNEGIVDSFIDKNSTSNDFNLILSDLERIIGKDYYQVLLLKIGYNYKFQEISEIIGLSLSKTKRLYYEALEKVEDYKRGSYEEKK